MVVSRMGRIFPLAVLSLLAPAALAAQEPIRPGDRLRVTAPALAPEPIEGRLVALDSAALRLAPLDAEAAAPTAAEARTIPLTGIRKLEVARGRRSHAGRGAILGAAIGGGAGLAIGIAAVATEEDNPDAWFDFHCSAWCIPAGMLGGAVWGTGIGALIGLATRSTRWEEVAPPRVSVAPAPRGFAVAVRLPR